MENGYAILPASRTRRVLQPEERRGRVLAAFEFALEDNLLALQSELQTRTYQPGGYSSFTIHEPKRRLISAAPFRDRVVHHALCNLIEPIFERSFIADSYANRKGKGTHRALDRCQQFARRHRYVLQCDLRQFFPSLDHAILMDCLARKLPDPEVRWLCQQILVSGADVHAPTYAMGWFPGDDLWAVARPRGLPIGNLTSQFWANVYLNPFDHFIVRQLGCRAYLRYVDDFLLFADDRRQLWGWLAAIRERLACLRLMLHSGNAPRPVLEGIPFLGWNVQPERRRLKARKGLFFRRKLARMLDARVRGELPADGLAASVAGWKNHVRYGNTVGLRKAVLGNLLETAEITNHQSPITRSNSTPPRLV